MKQLQKSDLKVGKVYRLKAFNREYLYRISDMRTSMTLCNDGFLIININKFNKISNISQSHDFADAKHIEIQERYKFYDATPEEKHWLKVCIEADKFVSYEEAMKTFKYVLKEELEEPKDKVLLSSSKPYLNAPFNIIKVESSEGAVFKLGDKITVFDKNSPNKGKPFTITGFRWNNAKTEICVGTEPHKPYGIRLSKIELYVEPKVEPKQELSLLEQAKLKYPVGTKVISLTSKNTHIIEGDIICGSQKSGIYNYIFGNDGGCTLYNPNTNRWAEIVDDFILPEKWCVEVNDEIRSKFSYYLAEGYHHSNQINNTNKWSYKIKKEFTEITLEQFKKYVLKDE